MKRLLVFDVGATNTKWAVMEDYQVLKKDSYHTPKELDSFMAAAEDIIKREGPGCDGIAVSILGTVLAGDEGRIEQGGNLPFMTGVSLGKRLSALSGLPVSVENDGRCAVLGEYAAGALKGYSYGFGLVLGTGLGGGLIIDGKLVRGAHSFAGEIGYSTLDWMSMPALGSVAGMRLSFTGLLERAKEEWQEKSLLRGSGRPELESDPPADTYQLFEMAEGDDPLAREAIRVYAKELAVLIWNIQCTLDPQCISIGGGLSMQPLLILSIQDELDELYDKFPYVIPRAKTAVSGLGNTSNLYGAAYVWQQRFGKEE